MFERHGGRLRAATLAFPTAPRPWIDLSTGVNPHAYPARSASRAGRGRLPDPEETAALEAAAASAFGLDEAGCVAAVPGSEAAIGLLPRLLGARSVAIGVPTYASHAEAWRAAGVTVALVPLAAIEIADAEVIIIVNPNNPDGRMSTPDTILRFARRQAARGGWMIVDEAFAEIAPEISVAHEVVPGLIVLRSFGKFHGLPGVRLGFVIAGKAVVSAVRATLGDWPVSADAIAAGLAAYSDRAWADRTRARLARDAMRLDRALVDAGFRIVGGTSLFRLTGCPDARMHFTRLAEAGILTRIFDGDPGLLRFGLPHRSHWARVEASLAGSAG